ncbi:Pyruvate kinase [Candidatus Magnetoovum chiemensis]|nr:Pyruvate kinase [Candidatus Magnetoovum chiemensis]
MIESKTYYFEKPGRINTYNCLNITIEAIKELGCKDIVVATTGGDTGLLFSQSLKDRGLNIVAVTHSYGFKEPNTIELPQDVAEQIVSNGAKLYTGTMLTHSLETALAVSFKGVYPTLLIAQTLRRFSEGVKVCCEIVMMAADAGLIREGKDVIAVAGTGRGADTVAVIRSAASKRFLDFKVQRIIAKPIV